MKWREGVSLAGIYSWGNPNQIIEFTHTNDVAAFTAEVAMDDHTPRYLRIAGDRLSCNGFVQLLTTLTNKKYKLFRPGGIGLLNVVIGITKFFSPAKNELYPAWQGMQYMRDMRWKAEYNFKGMKTTATYTKNGLQ